MRVEYILGAICFIVGIVCVGIGLYYLIKKEDSVEKIIGFKKIADKKEQYDLYFMSIIEGTTFIKYGVLLILGGIISILVNYIFGAVYLIVWIALVLGNLKLNGEKSFVRFKYQTK